MQMRLTCRDALAGGSPGEAQAFEHAAAEHPEMMRKMTEDDQTVTRRTTRTLLEEKQEEPQNR